jgi:hypothetical protein
VGFSRRHFYRSPAPNNGASRTALHRLHSKLNSIPLHSLEVLFNHCFNWDDLEYAKHSPFLPAGCKDTEKSLMFTRPGVILTKLVRSCACPVRTVTGRQLFGKG